MKLLALTMVFVFGLSMPHDLITHLWRGILDGFTVYMAYRYRKVGA